MSDFWASEVESSNRRADVLAQLGEYRRVRTEARWLRVGAWVRHPLSGDVWQVTAVIPRGEDVQVIGAEGEFTVASRVAVTRYAPSGGE